MSDNTCVTHQKLLMPKTESTTMNHTLLQYDNSFNGLLSSIFYCYLHHITEPQWLTTPNSTIDLFQQVIFVETNISWAERILKKIDTTVGAKGFKLIRDTYLTEYLDREQLIFAFIKLLIQQPYPKLLNNYADPIILNLHQNSQKIRRERHRMLAFVRFEQLENGIYFAKITPDFNVLPLIIEHFQARYADQQWLIFDIKRHYGFAYDLTEVHYVFDIEQKYLQSTDEFYHQPEQYFQTLWQTYFKHVNIIERANRKLHRQSLPERYWSLLTEKKDLNKNKNE